MFRYCFALLALGVVPAAALMMFGAEIFSVVFGEEWTQAGQFAELLSVGFLARFVVSPVSQLLTIIERQDLQLVWDVLRLLLLLGALLTPYYLDRPVEQVIGAYSIALALTQICFMLFTASVLVRVIK